ncbi:MAG: carboxypeptidase regulatory-like domain-containing protein [Tepidisphaeraceae bacterium]
MSDALDVKHSTHPRRASSFRRAIDTLEARQLMAAVYPTAYEQYMVELINRARANPSAEAARYNGQSDNNGNTFNGNLNEGLAANTISTAAKQPLAINPYLTDAARNHAAWIITNNSFGHPGAGGSTPSSRMASAGYSGATTTRENLGIDGNSSLPNDTKLIEDQHMGLFTDMSVNGRGHRVNLMANDVREVGSGVAKGSFDYTAWGLPQSLPSIVTAQDFATASGNPFLTGVAYTDTTRADNFYTPGEGMSGVTVMASNGSQTYTTTTWSSGGYSLQLPAGTYTVTATGGALGSNVVTYNSVLVGSQNVKKDFTPAQATSGGSLTRADVTNIVQTGSPLRSVTLTFNSDLGSSVSKDDFILQRRKDKRVVSGSYWKFSSSVNGQGKTVITVRVTKTDLQGKYQIVVKPSSVVANGGLPLDHQVTLNFFLQPIVSGASNASTPVIGTVLSKTASLDSIGASVFAADDAIL